MGVVAYIGLGSNLGRKMVNLQNAVFRLSRHPEIVITRVSSLYRTAPWGYSKQPWFLNGALELQTSLSPRELLGWTREVEAGLKKAVSIKWGPRIIDLDILLYGEMVVKEDGLGIPHPHLLSRPFVLIPLLEMSPGLIHPSGVSLAAALRELRAPGQSVVIFRKSWLRRKER